MVACGQGPGGGLDEKTCNFRSLGGFLVMSGRAHSALFAFGVVAIDAMGIGIIIPVMPDLLQELAGASVGEAARWGGYLAFSYALMQFIFSPVIGALSDRFGRRPVLLVSLATLAVDYVVMAMTPALWVLFVGRVIAGVAGATHATASAFIADVTPPEKRAAAFGLIGAGFGVGFVLGPVIGGLMGELGTRAPFYAAAALTFANLLYGLIFIPESLAEENRRPFDLARANPLGAMRQVARLPMVGWFVGVIFLFAPVGEKAINGDRVDHRARQDVSSDFSALFQHHHVDVFVDLFQPDCSRETRWPAADDDHVEFHAFTRFQCFAHGQLPFVVSAAYWRSVARC